MIYRRPHPAIGLLLVASLGVSAPVAAAPVAPAEEPGNGIPECDTWAAGTGAKPAPRSCVNAFTEEARLSLRLVDRKENKIRQNEQVLETFTGGIGQHGQRPFEVSSPWELRWFATGSFEIYMVDEAGKLIRTAAEQKKSGSGSTKQKEGGTVRLEMNAGGPWEVQIIEFVKNFSYEYDVTAEIKVQNPYAFPIDVDLSIDDEKPRTERIPAADYSIFSVPSKLGPYDERKKGKELLEELGEVRIAKVVNVSDSAATARIEADQEDQGDDIAKEEALESKREGASDEFVEFNEETRQERRKRREAQRRRDGDDVDSLKKLKQRRVVGGIVTAIVGGAGAAGLIVYGITRRVDANEALAEAVNCDDPNNLKQQGACSKRDLRIANGVIAGGGLLAAGTVVLSSVLFWSAGNIDAETADISLFPILGPGMAGVGLSGRF